jgi:hypothetical protein
VVQPWWIWLEANQRSATVKTPPGCLVNQLRLDQTHRGHSTSNFAAVTIHPVGSFSPGEPPAM